MSAEVKASGPSPGHVEEFTRKDAGRKIVVRLFWGVTNIGDESNAFFCMVKEAAERGSVFLYSGHSRVGGLDLTYMGDQIGSPIKVNTGQYQIYGFSAARATATTISPTSRRKPRTPILTAQEHGHHHQRRYRFVLRHGGFHHQDRDAHPQLVRARQQNDLAADHGLLLEEVPDRGQRRRLAAAHRRSAGNRDGLRCSRNE